MHYELTMIDDTDGGFTVGYDVVQDASDPDPGKRRPATATFPVRPPDQEQMAYAKAQMERVELQ